MKEEEKEEKEEEEEYKKKDEQFQDKIHVKKRRNEIRCSKKEE